MAQIEGIVKERYTEADIEENIEELIAAGIIDPDDEESLKQVAREFYFRGLVHGHAQEDKVQTVREDFGY